jgi:hypothetical protein
LYYYWKLNQSDVAISGRLANQKSGKKNWLVVQNVGWGCSLRRPRPITFYELALLLVIWGQFLLDILAQAPLNCW